MNNIDDRVSVLIIDSNDTDRNYYADRLKEYSSQYIVHQAANGECGLAIYEAQSIDCVVLELELADMSGFEALVRLVPIARKPNVPVIVLTHLANHYLTELALKNGAFACLLKTGAPGDTLDRTIQKAISVIMRDKKKAQLESTALSLEPLEWLHLKPKTI
jgi:DNA-binding NarL/FixJ family response regulator